MGSPEYDEMRHDHRASQLEPVYRDRDRRTDELIDLYEEDWTRLDDELSQEERNSLYLELMPVAFGMMRGVEMVDQASDIARHWRRKVAKDKASREFLADAQRVDPTIEDLP